MNTAWIKLELDLGSYQPPEINPEIAASNVRLTTFAELGDTHDNRYRLFELNRECSADIPGRGPFHTWEKYQELRLDVPWFDASTVSLAVEGDDWVGMASFTTHPRPETGDDHLFSEMTGVVRRWRRKGLATALKVHNLALATQTDMATMRTIQHPENTSMIDLNRGLGFVEGTWPYPC